MVDTPIEFGARVDEARDGVFDSNGNDVGVPEAAFVANRVHHVFQDVAYEILEVYMGDIWYGFLVDSGLGTTLHQVPITFDRDTLIRQHLNNPGIQKIYKETGAKMPLINSSNVGVLNAHGIADAEQISEILHPQTLSLIESLIQQKAFIVTKEAKIIDISAHEWPIDLEKATDVRATIGALVGLGGKIYTVAAIDQEMATIVPIRVQAPGNPALVKLDEIDAELASWEQLPFPPAEIDDLRATLGAFRAKPDLGAQDLPAIEKLMEDVEATKRAYPMYFGGGNFAASETKHTHISFYDLMPVMKKAANPYEVEIVRLIGELAHNGIDNADAKYGFDIDMAEEHLEKGRLDEAMKILRKVMELAGIKDENPQAPYNPDGLTGRQDFIKPLKNNPFKKENV